MLRRLGAHVRGQWMGALALFLVLGGGTVFAASTGTDGPNAEGPAGQNGVGSLDIIDGQVQRADIRSQAVTGAKVRNGSLDAADIDEEPWHLVADNPLDADAPDPCDGDVTDTFCGYAVGGCCGAFVYWGNYGGGYQTARYYRDAAGTVHVQGLVKSTGTVAARPTLFILPSGYRPGNRLLFSVDCQSESSPSTTAHGRVDINSDGRIRYESLDDCDVASYLSLTGIDFRAEQ